MDIWVVFSSILKSWWTTQVFLRMCGIHPDDDAWLVVLVVVVVVVVALLLDLALPPAAEAVELRGGW